MKKIVLSVIIFFMCYPVYGDSILFTQPEVINTPSAARMDWEISKINAADQIMHVKYRWLDFNNKPIRDVGNIMWHTWECRNIADNNPVSNTDCTAVGVPDICCDGVGTGACDIVDTCFTDVFGFSIRQQDVGTSIGLGLRTLIWNQMKADVLSGGNDGSFE